MRYLSVFVLMLLFCSCNKERIRLNSYDDLEGTFEWYHSVNVFNQSESLETIEDRYGITFKKNGVIKIFENGELIDEGYVTSVGEINAFNEQHVDCYLFGENFSFHLIEGNLENGRYPIKDYSNRFRKL